MTYPCALCGRYLGSEAAVQQHQRDSPSHAKSSSVEILDSLSGSNVTTHQKRHDSPTEAENNTPALPRSIICGICKRTFGSGKALHQHRQDAHENGKNQKGSARSDSETSPSEKTAAPLPAISPTYDDALEHRDVNLAMSSLNLGQKAAIRPSKQNIGKAASQKKTKKTRRSSGEETRIYFKFGNLHQRVEQAVLPEIRSTRFHGNSRDEPCQEEYSTFVMGKFECKNEACKKKEWSSGKVTILIKGYARNGYSATVYNQRCKACNHLGTFDLNTQSYVDRVAYRLKRWAGVVMAPQIYGVKKGPPHETRFCEGCKQGVCEEMNIFRY